MLSAFLSRHIYQKRFIIYFISIVAILLLFPVCNHNARAADVTLEWDPNPEPDIAGYEVYYGESSRDYPVMIDVNNFTSCTIGNLETGVTYYFAAKAYNTAGYRSDYSDEVTYTPAAPVADILVDPDTCYFGNVMAGDVSDVTITVANDGIADLHIGTIGGLSAPFSIVTDNCSGEIISQGDSRTFAVRFAPATDASFDDTISIPSNDPDENPVAIVIHGTGTPEPLDNQPPVSDAGPNQTVNEGVTVTLDGSSSYDTDDGIASYQWSQISGTPVTLSNPSSITPTFVAPNVGPEGTSLTFQLTVTDSGNLQSTDTCIVNVTWDNQPPVADAGPDQTVDEGTTVTLDGSSSYDPDDGIASHEWTQISGSTVNLSNPSSATPTFVAPNVGPEGTSLTFQLTVTDSGNLQSTDTCVVNITWDNQPPVADAGSNQTVNEGTTVTLDGSSSYDTESGIESYRWTQTGGPLVTLSDPTEVMPTFVTAPVGVEGAVLEFQLTVSDNGGLENSSSMTVTIRDNGITIFSKDIISTTLSSGEAIGFREGKDSKLISLYSIEQFKIPADENNEPLSLVMNSLIDMKIKIPVPGGEAKITVYLDKSTPDESTLYHYSRTDSSWSDYSNYAEFNATRNQVKITLVDGGMGDDDGVADGIIVDPFAFVLSSDSSTVPSSDDKDEDLDYGCFIGTSASGSFVDTGKTNQKQNAILMLLLCGVVLGMRLREMF